MKIYSDDGKQFATVEEAKAYEENQNSFVKRIETAAKKLNAEIEEANRSGWTTHIYRDGNGVSVKLNKKENNYDEHLELKKLLEDWLR